MTNKEIVYNLTIDIRTMNKFISLRNKCIKRIAQICCLTTIGFVFQACYGPPRDRHFYEREICIRLVDPDGKPLEGIKVTINDSIEQRTSEYGYLLTFLPLDEECKIHISGNDNYQPFDTIIPTGESYVSFDVALLKN